MSQLPPYSTFRTDAKQMMFPQATSHGNILTFTPPGFKQSLNVKFPDSRLAVCEKCKKNFKTKDMCRVRNAHTAPPWTTAYVCVTIDDSCTDEDGKFIDKPMTLRMVTWRPYAVRKPFHHKTPVCAGCKRTNRTRSFCRERHKHKQLPWCTVYVLLSALDQADPATIVAGPSRPVSDDGSKSPETSSPHGETGKARAIIEGEDSKPVNRATDVASACSETISSDVDDTDDINDIPESRTFMAKVNCRGSSIHWLDLVDYEDPAATPTYASPEAAAAAAFTTPQMDPKTAQAQYYPQAHYAQEQHQNALKTHQQYFFQQQQYAWQQQYAQQLARVGLASGGIITTGEGGPASQQRRAQGEQGAASPTAAAVTSSPTMGAQAQQQQQHRTWPIYYGALPTGYYSPPSIHTTNTAQQHPHAAEYNAGQDQYQQAAADPGALDHENTGGNSEEEPDAKRLRSI